MGTKGFFSTDAGNSFNQIYFPNDFGGSISLVSVANNFFTSYQSTTGGTLSIFSNDNGTTWNIIPGVPANTRLFHANASQVLCFSSDMKFALSNNGGNTWTNISAVGLNLTNSDVVDILPLGNYLFIASAKGLYRKKL